MKQRIFSRGQGWYIPCKNYKDDNDKATVYVNFKRGEEPQYQPPQGQDWCFVDIDIEDAKFGCSKGRPNMMVWSYTKAENNPVKSYKRSEFKGDIDNFDNDDLGDEDFPW